MCFPWAARARRSALGSLGRYKTSVVGLTLRREGLSGLADLILPPGERKARSHRTIEYRRNGDVRRLATSTTSMNSS
eukprot:721722-Prymnesium_polylepis.2